MVGSASAGVSLPGTPGGMETGAFGFGFGLAEARFDGTGTSTVG